MPRIEGVDRLERKLAALADQRRNCSVVVGFSAPYAIFVHENMELHPPGMLHAGESRGKGRGLVWDPQGIAQPKFLEGPARQFARELGEVARMAYEAGRTLGQSLLLMGLRLQAYAQQRVPVDYGFLKSSAFTELKES